MLSFLFKYLIVFKSKNFKVMPLLKKKDHKTGSKKFRFPYQK